MSHKHTPPRIKPNPGRAPVRYIKPVPVKTARTRATKIRGDVGKPGRPVVI